MEFEQIIKRLDWMEKERAKDKEVIASLKEQIASLEASINVASKQIKGLGIQISEVNVGASRFEQFDTMLTKQRADVNSVIENYEKQSQLNNIGATQKVV